MRKSRFALGGVLVTIVVFVTISALSGVIGNRSDAIVVKHWRSFIKFMYDPVEMTLWIYVSLILLGIFILILAFFLLMWKVRNALASGIAEFHAARAELVAFRYAISLVELDDTLLRLLPRLVRSDDLEEAMKRLVVEFFRDATKVFGGDVSRGMVLRIQGDELAAWTGYQMPEETLTRTRFSLADSSTTGAGVALKTFRDGKFRVVKMKREVKGPRHKWTASSRNYKVFDSSQSHPPYHAFVTVAVGDGSSENIGVVCFDSMNPSAFDPPEIQQFLMSLARRVGTAMQIYDWIHQSRTTN